MTELDAQRKDQQLTVAKLDKDIYDVGYYLRGCGQDDDGEIYLAVSSRPEPQGNTGKVFKLVTVER